MGHGGKREGAGRKPGSTNKRTREIAERAAAEGLSPLEVMLQAMRQLLDSGQLKDAAEIAAKAAPYIHPRLANVELTSTTESVVYQVSAEPMSIEEWEAKHCQPEGSRQ